MAKKLVKKVRSFSQLESILRKRGEPGRTDSSAKARLVGNVWIEAQCGPCIYINYHATGFTYPLASVWSVAGGDTVYLVPGCADAARDVPKYRAAWRGYVQRLTPRVVTGRVPKRYDSKWYRIHDGVATETPAPHDGKMVRQAPINHSRLFPSATIPAMQQWLRPATDESLPKFAARTRAFYVNLRRALQGGVPCTLQRLNYWQACHATQRRYALSRRQSMHLHVCTPPTERGKGRQLVVQTNPHDAHSRMHFHVDGDYGMRHSQFGAYDADDPNTKMWWPSAKDAIIGIKEWLMQTIYIPGPDL